MKCSFEGQITDQGWFQDSNTQSGKSLIVKGKVYGNFQQDNSSLTLRKLKIIQAGFWVILDSNLLAGKGNIYPSKYQDQPLFK